MTFEADMVACAPILRRLAWRFVHDDGEADELVQQTFFKALTKRDLFTPGTNIAGWLTVILKNEFYGRYRYRRRMVEDPDGLIAAQVMDEDTRWSVDLVEIRDEARVLLAAMEHLKPLQREVIWGLVDGLKYHQIAARHCIPVGTVKSVAHRARLALKEALDA